MKEKGLTLGCAESCTGGLIAKRMTDLSGVSAVFRGGVVSYATEVKHTVLGVDQALLDEFGAVSEPVARAMAEGARRVLGCDLAVASTGVAGPDPDERGNPVGLVYLALAAPDGTWVRKIQQGLGRERVRHVSASHAFDLARRYLSGLEVKIKTAGILPETEYPLFYFLWLRSAPKGANSPDAEIPEYQNNSLTLAVSLYLKFLTKNRIPTTISSKTSRVGSG